MSYSCYYNTNGSIVMLCQRYVTYRWIHVVVFFHSCFEYVEVETFENSQPKIQRDKEIKKSRMKSETLRKINVFTLRDDLETQFVVNVWTTLQLIHCCIQLAHSINFWIIWWIYLCSVNQCKCSLIDIKAYMSCIFQSMFHTLLTVLFVIRYVCLSFHLIL